MLFLILAVICYCITTAFSISLLGDKKLLSSNLFQVSNMLRLLFNWKFMLSMALAIGSRLTFVVINSTILKIPYLAGAATTVSVFVTLISIVFIIVANHYFLNETLNLRQGIGAFIVVAGICIMLTN